MHALLDLAEGGLKEATEPCESEPMPNGIAEGDLLPSDVNGPHGDSLTAPIAEPKGPLQDMFFGSAHKFSITAQGEVCMEESGYSIVILDVIILRRTTYGSGKFFTTSFASIGCRKSSRFNRGIFVPRNRGPI